MKYKNTLFIYLLILINQLFLQAQVLELISLRNVTKEMAQQVAQTFLLSAQATLTKVATKTKGEFIVRNQAVGLTLGETKPINNERDQILAYVQELIPKGFIIVSADVRMRSILGFSFDSNFNLEYNKSNPLLDLVIADVNARKLIPLLMKKGTIQLSNSTEWGPWLQTVWRQGAHWNNKCPLGFNDDPNQRRIVGCVATATAQIINYWKYPKSLSFTTSDDFYISGNKVDFSEATNYGFPTASELNNTLQDISYNGDLEEEANLSFGIGVKLGMNYGTSGSGASVFKVAEILNNNFGFGSAKAFNNNSDLWATHRSEIIENIKNGWPVQIAIHKSSGWSGHSIIVDGYRDNDEFFHLNFGWGADAPVSIGNAWYNIPNMPSGYDVVHTVVFGISKYQGWNQVGANQKNNYHSVYAAPISEPVRKWPVNMPANLPGNYSYKHLVIGTGGRIYSTLGPQILGDNDHPYIAIYDKFGTLEKLIEVTQSNVDIDYLCQNSQGEIFFQSGTAGPTATNSKIYKLDPKTDTIDPIFIHNSPDPGISELPIKVDKDDNLYFLIQPRISANYSKFYIINRTGTNWKSISFPSSSYFYFTVPVIDEEKDQVYLNYFKQTEQTKGESHLIAINRSNGSIVFDKILPTSNHSASYMASAPSITDDGTIYVDANHTLFALRSSDGVVKWQKSLGWRAGNLSPSIGTDGTLYALYDAKVIALDPSNGSTKWERLYTFGQTDHFREIYSASNGMVVISYLKDGINRLGGIKDNGSNYENKWDIEGGGMLAFGPGRTIFSIPPGYNQSIWALTDYGEFGDPEGKGMDYLDNSPPLSPALVSPINGALEQDTSSIQLSWNCSDPNGHNLKYDIYVSDEVKNEEGSFVLAASKVIGNTFTITNLLRGTQYLWTVVATDGQALSGSKIWNFTTKDKTTGIHDANEANVLPKEYTLKQNYPNPFNPSTIITYEIPEQSFVSLKIYDIIGREIIELVNEEKTAGSYKVSFNPNNLSSGVYFYRISALSKISNKSFIKTGKMILLR